MAIQFGHEFGDNIVNKSFIVHSNGAFCQEITRCNVPAQGAKDLLSRQYCVVEADNDSIL